MIYMSIFSKVISILFDLSFDRGIGRYNHGVLHRFIFPLDLSF